MVSINALSYCHKKFIIPKNNLVYCARKKFKNTFLSSEQKDLIKQKTLIKFVILNIHFCVCRAAVTTLTASIGGGITGIVGSRLIKPSGRKFDISYLNNGVLGGLVSITSKYNFHFGTGLLRLTCICVLQQRKQKCWLLIRIALLWLNSPNGSYY